MSNVPQWTTTYVNKDGVRIFAQVAIQKFYDMDGETKWIIGCVDSWSYDCAPSLEFPVPNNDQDSPWGPLRAGTTAAAATTTTPQAQLTAQDVAQMIGGPETLATATSFTTNSSSDSPQQQSPLRASGQHTFASSVAVDVNCSEPSEMWIEHVMRAPMSSPLENSVGGGGAEAVAMMSPLFSAWMESPQSSVECGVGGSAGEEEEEEEQQSNGIEERSQEEGRGTLEFMPLFSSDLSAFEVHP